MFSITDTSCTGTCAGWRRREFLRVGSLGFGGLSLASLLASKSQAASGASLVRDKAVVLLFLQGGPAHIEMFDPKMSAPMEIRSTTGEVQTRLPGVTFGGTFGKMGQLADRLAIVRSYGSKNSGHTYVPVTTAGNSTGASMGAMYSRIRGSNHPETGMPLNTLVLPEAVEDGLKLGSNFETGALPGLSTPGNLGATYAAFDSSGGGQLKENMELRLPRNRFDDRRALLNRLDQVRRGVEASGLLETVDVYRQQAFDVILRGVAAAFDLSREDSRTIARYDTTHLFPREKLNRYYDMRRASNLLGKQMLLARRLVEAGCGFVTVADAGWDMHGNGNSMPQLSGLLPLGNQVDHAVSAFLEDLEERGLSDKVLLVITGEMGRTPRINSRGGRDHYGELTSLVLAGGGLKMGQVIGQSDAHAAKPATEPFNPKNLLATIMHVLFDVAELRLASSVPRDLAQAITETDPISGLL